MWQTTGATSGGLLSWHVSHYPPFLVFIFIFISFLFYWFAKKYLRRNSCESYRLRWIKFLFYDFYVGWFDIRFHGKSRNKNMEQNKANNAATMKRHFMCISGFSGTTVDVRHLLTFIATEAIARDSEKLLNQPARALQPAGYDKSMQHRRTTGSRVMTSRVTWLAENDVRKGWKISCCRPFSFQNQHAHNRPRVAHGRTQKFRLDGPRQRRQIRNAEPPTDPLAFWILVYPTLCQNCQHRFSIYNYY